MNIKDLKIRSKLFAAFSLIISLMILIGYLSYQGLDSIKTTLNTIFSVNMPSLDYLIEADRDLQQLLVAERSMISMESNSQGYSSQEEDYNKNLKQMYERFGKFKALINYPEATALIDKFEQDRSTWEPISHEVVEKSRSTDPAVKKAALELSLHKSAEAFETMRDSIDKLTEIVLNHATTDHQNSDSTFKQALTMLLTIIAVASIAAGIIVWSLNITITRPIKQAVAGLKDIAKGEGDLTQRLAIRSNDEIGEMAHWINSFMEKLQGIIHRISNNTSELGKSSGNLLEVANLLMGSAADSSSQVNNMVGAVNRMNSNLNNVAAAMEQSTTNVTTVANAANEMNATIGNISRNVQQANAVVGEAVDQASRTATRMDALGSAAQAIGKVTETITEISEQTNLLALNATIEAARAGDAGKGFAVVANEIKELARQTAQATLNIKEQIAGVQLTTSETVTDIGSITKVINQVSEIVSTIANAVSEQSAATEEIAENISQASQGLQEVNENVNQSSVVANAIADDLNGIGTVSSEIATNSKQVRTSAASMEQLLSDLRSIVQQFRI